MNIDMGIGPRFDFQVGYFYYDYYSETDARNPNTFRKIIWGINSSISFSYRISDRFNIEAGLENEYDIRPINNPDITSSYYNQKIRNNIYILRVGVSWKVN